MSNTSDVTHVATLDTSLGTIEIELYGKDAPKTVENFTGLIERGAYDGVLFHRVVRGFVVQAGDPQTRDASMRSRWGTGGDSIYGGTFADELNPGTASYQRGYAKGVVAMANRGPNTNTSQFFIMLADNQGLPKNYTIFGAVRQGQEVVDALGAVKVDGRDGPIEPVEIKSATVEKAPQE